MRSLLLLPTLALASLSLALGIGDKAPALKVEAVVKGQTPDLSKGLHVVEFWTPTSGASTMSVPRLNEIAKRYKGKVDVTGVSLAEDDQDSLGLLKKYVASAGARLDYNILYDGSSKAMNAAYCDAAQIDNIPAAFLIKDGTIVWIGHPMGNLQAAIDRSQKGKDDLEGAKAEFAKWQADTARENAENQKRQQELAVIMRPVVEAMQQNDFDAALNELDKAESKKPELKSTLAPFRFSILVDSGSAKLVTLAKRFASDDYKSDPETLNEMAWSIVDPETKLTKPNFEAALILSKQAAEASKMKDGAILDTYALALFKTGDKKKALEVQKKAVDLVKKDKDADPDTIKELQGRLEEYKKANA